MKRKDLRPPAAWCGLLRPPSKRAKLPEQEHAQLCFPAGKRGFSEEGDAESDAVGTSQGAAWGRRLVAVE